MQIIFNSHNCKEGGSLSSQKKIKTGAPGGIRTPDLRIRSPTLYPAELQAQKK